VEYGTQQAVCPRCGSAAEVLTVQEMVDLLGLAQDQAAQAREQLRQRRPDPRDAGRWLVDDQSPRSTQPDQELANAAIAMAGRFIGKAISKRVRRTYEERVLPTLEAQAEQSRREQIAIAERHPDLRCCLGDQVVFLAGGTRVVPLAGLSGQITLAQADALVASLRAP